MFYITLHCSNTKSYYQSIIHVVGPPLVSPLLYSSYPEQQYDEILRVLDYATSVELPVLMGDFNHGPVVPGGVMSTLPFHYGLMTARGFYSPYVLQDGRCTWCLENAQAVAFFPANTILDHIYITTNTQERVKSVEVHTSLCCDPCSSVILLCVCICVMCTLVYVDPIHVRKVYLCSNVVIQASNICHLIGFPQNYMVMFEWYTKPYTSQLNS